jgi:hypothetical protein
MMQYISVAPLIFAFFGVIGWDLWKNWPREKKSKPDGILR